MHLERRLESTVGVMAGYSTLTLQKRVTELPTIVEAPREDNGSSFKGGS